MEQVSFKTNEQTLLLTLASKQEILTWLGELWKGWRSSGPWRLLVDLPVSGASLVLWGVVAKHSQSHSWSHQIICE